MVLGAASWSLVHAVLRRRESKSWQAGKVISGGRVRQRKLGMADRHIRRRRKACWEGKE